MKLTQIASLKNIFFFLGITSTCSCVAFVGMGSIVSLYAIFLLLAFVVLLLDKGTGTSVFGAKNSKYYCFWIFVSILSSIFGMIFFEAQQDWLKATISYIPKLLLYFLLFYLLARSSHRDLYITFLLKGLLLGVVVNIAWAIADAIIYYVFKYSITNTIFNAYIVATNTRYGMLSLIIGGVMRSGGLNGDPANIGMFGPILASYGLYSKKYWLYILALLSIFASVSIVALASIFIISTIYMFSNIKALGIGIVFLLLSTFCVSYFVVSKDEVSGQMLEAVTDRIDSKVESGNSDKESVRKLYWTKFFPSAIATPTAFIIGTGYGTASYAYINGGYVKTSNPYDPEQTYCSTYFDIGLFGFLAFVLLHISILKYAYRHRNEKNCLMLFSGIEGIMISFMGYHYTVYSVAMLFLIAGTIITSSKECNLKKY